MSKLIPKKQTAWGKLEYKGLPPYSQVIEQMKKEDPQAYNRLQIANARSQQPNSEVVRWKDANGKEQTSTTNIGMSGADPIGQLYVEGVALNPIFKGLGRVAEYGLAKAGNKWARAKIINRQMQNISTPNKTIPNNVGWAPKQTIQVSHARNRNEIPDLYFEKRWDVVNEGANPHGIWYQGKLGVPRTDLTNPGKGIKAQKARDLFANRKYHLKGEVTFEKPMQTIGDVKNRSQLSYDADNMGADGLIYNDIYDNGYNHNQVILGWKQFNKNKEFKKGGILKYQNSGKFSHYTDEQKVLLKRNDEATQNLYKLHNSNTIKNNREQIQKEIDLVQNALNQQANQFKELGTLYKQASDNQVQKAKDEFYPYKNMANSLATAGELLSAGYFLAKGVGKGAQLGTKLIGTRRNRYGFPVFSGKWRERYDKIGKFLNTWDRGQVAMNSLGTTSDVGQLLMGDNSWQNKAEIGLDIGGVVGGTNIVRNTPWFGRYRKAIDSTLDAGGYSAAGYDIYNYLSNE